MNRLEQYIGSGHVPDKIELIIMGGTFPSFPKTYQEYFGISLGTAQSSTETIEQRAARLLGQ